MKTLKHGKELLDELYAKYKDNFRVGTPGFHTVLWNLLIKENWKDNKPHCFVSVITSHGSGWMLGIAEHGETGYVPTYLFFNEGMTHDQTEDVLESLNEDMFGLGVRAAAKIVLSSLRSPDRSKFDGKDAQEIWNELSDVCITEDMEIDSDFYHFPAGTECEDIWHELEDYFGITVGEMHVTRD